MHLPLRHRTGLQDHELLALPRPFDIPRRSEPLLELAPEREGLANPALVQWRPAAQVVGQILDHQPRCGGYHPGRP